MTTSNCVRYFSISISALLYYSTGIVNYCIFSSSKIPNFSYFINQNCLYLCITICQISLDFSISSFYISIPRATFYITILYNSIFSGSTLSYSYSSVDS
ncbi:hypothetical protein ES705_47349 [subsurface metagenome]